MASEGSGLATEDSRPQFTDAEAQELLRTHYNVNAVSLKSLPSYDDQNFLITTDDDTNFVFKIHMSTERLDVLELQNSVINYLASHGLRTPQVQATVPGALVARVPAPAHVGGDGQHYIRLLSFLPGTTLYKIKPQPLSLLRDLGTLLGQVDMALQGFVCPQASRYLEWDMAHAGSVVQDHIAAIKDQDDLAVLQHYIKIFEGCQTIIKTLPQQIIHNDGNDQNIVVDEDGQNIVGLIDYGDTVKTHTINELAIAGAYVLLEKEGHDAVDFLIPVVQGYHAVRPLSADELAVLYPLCMMRVVVSLVMGAHTLQLHPDNVYLLSTHKPGWYLLRKQRDVEPETVLARLREACGMK